MVVFVFKKYIDKTCNTIQMNFYSLYISHTFGTYFFRKFPCFVNYGTFHSVRIFVGVYMVQQINKEFADLVIIVSQFSANFRYMWV